MYRAVGDGNAASDLHRGVQAEAAVLRDLLYGDRETWLSRILPVILPGRSVDELPAFVQPASASHLLQSIGSNGAAGPVTEQELDPQVGAVFTRVDIWTPDDHSFACDYLRRPEDKPVCDQVDPAAAVELPG